MEEGIKLVAKSAGGLLNSGYLVVTALMLFIMVLLVIIVWLFRENRRLTDILLDIQRKTIQGFADANQRIDLLLGRRGNGG